VNTQPTVFNRTVIGIKMLATVAAIGFWGSWRTYRLYGIGALIKDISVNH
jgi:hypothetical protein